MHENLRFTEDTPTSSYQTAVYNRTFQKIFFSARAPKNSWGKRKSFCQMPCLVKTLACIFIVFTNLKAGIILHNFFQARIILQLNEWIFKEFRALSTPSIGEKYIEATKEVWLEKYALWKDIQTCY